MTPDASKPERGAAISVRNLRVNYGEREILHGISFDVQPGETLVILGGSGSGKSTLLRTLVGLERAASGEIWIGGKESGDDIGRGPNELRKTDGNVISGRSAVRIDVGGRKRGAAAARAQPAR